MFSEQTRVTLVAILLCDMNDSDLQLLTSDIISENSHEKRWYLFLTPNDNFNEQKQLLFQELVVYIYVVHGTLSLCRYKIRNIDKIFNMNNAP